jgi:hypothetical protein
MLIRPDKRFLSNSAIILRARARGFPRPPPSSTRGKRVATPLCHGLAPGRVGERHLISTARLHLDRLSVCFGSIPYIPTPALIVGSTYWIIGTVVICQREAVD